MGFSVRKLLQDTLLYSSGQILPRLVALLLLPVFSRYLTPEDYGILGQIAILSLVATSVVGFGLNMSLAKAYFDTESRSIKNGLIWSSFLVLLALNAGLFAVVFTLAPTLSAFLLNSPNYHELILIAFGSVTISGLIIPFVSYLKLEQKPRTVVLMAVLEVLATSALSFYFVIYQGIGAMGPLLGQFLAQALLLVLFAGIILVRVPFTLFLGKSFWMAFVVGLPYMFSFLGSFLIQSGTRFALVETRGLEEGGIYFVSQNCAKVLELFIMGMMTAWLPLFARGAKDAKESAISIKKASSAFILIISIPIAAAFLFAKPLLHLLVPYPLSTGWSSVGLLALSQGILGFYALLQPAFVFAKKSLLQVTLEASCGVIGVLSALFLTSYYGILGAAGAQAFACLLLASGALIIVKTLLPLQLENGRIAKVAFSLFAIALSSYYQSDSLILQLLEASIILSFYIVFLWRDVVTEQERKSVFTYTLQ